MSSKSGSKGSITVVFSSCLQCGEDVYDKHVNETFLRLLVLQLMLVRSLQ